MRHRTKLEDEARLSPKPALATAVVCFAASIAIPLASAQAQRLRLSNPLDTDRTPEVIEIPLSQLAAHLDIAQENFPSLIAQDSTTGKRIPAQLYSGKAGSPPDTLLLLVQLPANSMEDIRFRLDPKAPEQQPLVFGREAPERKDDFAWENQLTAYRIYGPALQATGEITSGIDVWSKRVPNFVIDNFYKRDHEGTLTHNPALSYHKDSGQGLDSYYVGPSRGCGGTAALVNGKLFVSKNYTTLRMLSNGPIRFAFEVAYAPWDAAGTTVVETKRITLDAGTHMNKIESRYSFQGSSTMALAAGIAIHEGADADFPVSGSVASVWDTPQDPSAGRISTGLVTGPDQHAETRQADGHALLIFTRHSNEPFVYYAGSGWSKADMPTADAWKSYLKAQLLQIEHPITLRWSAR
jgi:hypothetical protein